MKGVRWAYGAGTRNFCSALAALVGPVQIIYFLTVDYFNSYVRIAQQAGQTAVLGPLSLSVSGINYKAYAIQPVKRPTHFCRV
jgi:hypothetical protein